MNFLSWVLVGGALASAAVAAQAGNNLQVAVPAGAVAVLLIAIVGAAELQSEATPLAPARAGIVRQPPRERVESDSLLRLRRAFSSGTMGRSSILATVRALERDMSPSGRTSLSLEAEGALLNLPPEQFRQWVDERLRRIETST